MPFGELSITSDEVAERVSGVLLNTIAASGFTETPLIETVITFPPAQLAGPVTCESVAAE